MRSKIEYSLDVYVQILCNIFSLVINILANEDLNFIQILVFIAYFINFFDLIYAISFYFYRTFYTPNVCFMINI